MSIEYPNQEQDGPASPPPSLLQQAPPLLSDRSYLKAPPYLQAPPLIGSGYYWQPPQRKTMSPMKITLLVVGIVLGVATLLGFGGYYAFSHEHGLEVTHDLPTFGEIYSGEFYGSYQVSPDGRKIAYTLVNDEESSIYVAYISSSGTMSSARRVGDFDCFFVWGENGTHLLCWGNQDQGSYSYIYSLDVRDGTRIDIATSERPFAFIEPLGPYDSHPNYYYFTANTARDRSENVVYWVDLTSGKYKAVDWLAGFETPICYDGRIRVGLKSDPESDDQVIYWYSESGNSVEVMRIPFANAAGVDFVAGDSKRSLMYFTAAVEGDHADLYSLNIDTGEVLLAERSKVYDIVDALIDQRTGKVLAVAESHHRTEWRAVDPAFGSDLNKVLNRQEGDLSLRYLSAKQGWVLATIANDREHPYFYLWNLKNGVVTSLKHGELAKPPSEMARMRPVEIKARDGLEVPAYLTLPVEMEHLEWPDEPLPMILLVHGGPHTRDEWGWNPEVQYLAAHGFAVLQVNYRISTGFGVNHYSKGFKQFGKAMYTDLLDAVDWAVEEEIAKPDQVACMGWSYGGYAAMWSCVRPEGRFSVAIAINGLCDLVEHAEYVEDISKEAFSWDPLMGDADLSTERRAITEASPLWIAHEASIPILLVSGESDSIVNAKQTHDFRDALTRAGKEVNHLSFYNAGHSLGGYDEYGIDYRTRLYVAVTEFLSRRWGTPWRGSRFLHPTAAAGVYGESEDLEATSSHCLELDFDPYAKAQEEKRRIHEARWPSSDLERAAIKREHNERETPNWQDRFKDRRLPARVR